MMPRVYVGVGSNINPEKNIPKALRLLDDKIPLTALSTFYQTFPVEREHDPVFYNGIAALETDLPPEHLKENILRVIESDLLRVRTGDRYAARTIDLDIVLYGSAVVKTPVLEIPDPDITTRAFIALPLYELVPELILPDSGTALQSIVSRFQHHTMKRLSSFTAALRKEILHEKKES